MYDVPGGWVVEHVRFHPVTVFPFLAGALRNLNMR